VFTGGGALDAVEAVCGADAVTGLAALVAGNLVRMPPGATLGASPDAPRASLLETIREYGTEQLEACAEADGARQRHAAWYLALAERAAPALAGPDVVTWLARLDAEHDNLRAALRWVLDKGDGLTALRLAGALGRYWAHRGHLSEGRQWCAEALALVDDRGAGTALVRINCLVAVGRLAIGQAAYGEAERLANEAEALFSLGWGVSNAGSPERARALVAEALDLFAELGETGEHAEALFVLGTVTMYTGDYRGAVGIFEQSLAARRARGDEHTAARHLSGLGSALLNLGDRPRGRAVLEESLDVAREYEDRWSEAMSLMLLGHQRLADGDPGRARSGLTEAAALFQATGNMVYLAWYLEGLAGVAAAEHRLDRAAEIAGGRDALRVQTGVLLPPVYPAAWERTLATVRDGLGAAAFDEARGRLADRPPPDIIAAARPG
jgi:tetratricopeptide (TPR) repeat protein